MTTPAEHYAKAEMYAEAVAGDYDLDNATIRVYLGLAQIHATLALAPAPVADEISQPAALDAQGPRG